MKKAIICFLALAILLAMNVSAFAADFENQVDAIPYTVPSSAVTDEMRGLRYDVLEKYPGLKPIDPADVDSTLPVITINSMGELNCFMAGVSAAPLYEEGYDVSAFVNNYLASLEYAQEELAPSLATTSNYGDAPAYHQENSESINCYGYAADFNWFIRPGDIYYSVAPLLPTMTVECWNRTTGNRATTSTFESETDHWPFVPVVFSNARLISGLNPDHEYYFIFRKDIPGALARITGTISH